MRKTNIIIFLIAVMVFAATFLLSLVSFPESDESDSNQDPRTTAGSSHMESDFKVPKSGIHTFIGKQVSEITRDLGEPERIDPTPFGYDWYIYGRNSERYLQIGIDSQTRRVTTIYALGKELSIPPFKMGEASQKVYSQVRVSDTPSLNYRGTSIHFELNEEDMMVRPLIKFGKGWVQLNFDHVTDRLTGVRYMTTKVLAEQHPYSMTYSGQLPSPQETLNDKEWETVNQAEDKQILDMSNVFRKRFHLEPLRWSEEAHRAAYKHSREMYTKKYFSHDSKWSGDLSARLKRENIRFRAAGENIAAKYPDAVAVTLGWLNSIDHRKNLLSDIYTELGVGSYKNFYTQDFVTPQDF